jgi:hypothetical protein
MEKDIYKGSEHIYLSSQNYIFNEQNAFQIITNLTNSPDFKGNIYIEDEIFADGESQISDTDRAVEIDRFFNLKTLPKGKTKKIKTIDFGDYYREKLEEFKKGKEVNKRLNAEGKERQFLLIYKNKLKNTLYRYANNYDKVLFTGISQKVKDKLGFKDYFDKKRLKKKREQITKKTQPVNQNDQPIQKVKTTEGVINFLKEKYLEKTKELGALKTQFPVWNLSALYIGETGDFNLFVDVLYYSES